jgi:hypothetical protein
MPTLDLFAVLIFDTRQATMKSGKYFLPAPGASGSPVQGAARIFLPRRRFL